MTETLYYRLLLSRIETVDLTALENNPNTIALGGPAHSCCKVREASINHCRFLVFNVPNAHCAVSSVSSKHIICGSVPLETKHLFGVAFQFAIPFLNVVCNATFGNNPKLGCPVFTCRCKQLLDERRESHVRNASSVTFNEKDMVVESLEVISGENGDTGVSLPRQGCKDTV